MVNYDKVLEGHESYEGKSGWCETLSTKVADDIRELHRMIKKERAESLMTVGVKNGEYIVSEKEKSYGGEISLDKTRDNILKMQNDGVESTVSIHTHPDIKRQRDVGLSLDDLFAHVAMSQIYTSYRGTYVVDRYNGGLSILGVEAKLPGKYGVETWENVQKLSEKYNDTEGLPVNPSKIHSDLVNEIDRQSSWCSEFIEYLG